MKSLQPSFVFFGSDEFSIGVLDALEKAALAPSLVVTIPARPQGRGLALSATPLARFAETRHIPVAAPASPGSIAHTLQTAPAAFFVVASYGRILPKEILAIPARGILNVHPSLLPKYRGATPIESAILDGAAETGVTIILMDEKVDHGPIVAARKIPIDPARQSKREIGSALAAQGGALLAEVIPRWLAGDITPMPQDESLATCTKKMWKQDGRLNLAGPAEENWRKFRAYEGWPGTYFLADRNGKRLRVKIAAAELRDGAFNILRVIPEGRREMDYESFLRGLGARKLS